MATLAGHNYGTISAKELADAIEHARRWSKVDDEPFVVQHWCEFLREGGKVCAISKRIHDDNDLTANRYRRLILTVEPSGLIRYATQAVAK
jgi:hypothetical protein